ncbi:hypothetical protein K2173_012679 [Erythroxylum novogranatense]|uniref:Uncharacterized protein n=1 Tax=Erythroxylum novogranatense TaxID=1862640 RepID=A0AAV8TMD4_9ROSI|nr:hypothetical protein K2173_012679 [Erythroxylum novogranatense]
MEGVEALDTRTDLEPSTGHHPNDSANIEVDSVETISTSSPVLEQSSEPPQPSDGLNEERVGGDVAIHSLHKYK